VVVNCKWPPPNDCPT